MEYPDVPPRFPGDDFAELRGVIYAARKDTLRVFAQIVVDRYTAAWRTVGRPVDAVKDCLDAEMRFDANSFLDGHELLAAYWRKKFNWCQPTIPGIKHIDDLLGEWQVWLFNEVRSWALYEPLLIRRVCLILVQQNVVPGILEEWDFGMEIMRLYPIKEAGWPDQGIIMRRPNWKEME